MKATAIASVLLSVAGTVADSWSLRGTTLDTRPELAGTVLADQLRPFSGTDSAGRVIKGTLQDRVVQRTRGGTLDFYYRIMLDADSTVSIFKVVREGFEEVDVRVHDANWRIDGVGSVGPSLAYHDKACCFEMIYQPNFRPGEESRFVFIETGLKRYDTRGAIKIYPVDLDETYVLVQGFSPVF